MVHYEVLEKPRIQAMTEASGIPVRWSTIGFRANLLGRSYSQNVSEFPKWLNWLRLNRNIIAA